MLRTLIFLLDVISCIVSNFNARVIKDTGTKYDIFLENLSVGIKLLCWRSAHVIMNYVFIK